MKEKMNDLEESLKKIFSPVIGLLDTIHVRQKVSFASLQFERIFR